MIKELIYENKNVAFFCSTLEHFRELIVESKKEGIVFSKTGWIEEDFKIYENYFHKSYPHIALMVYNRYHISALGVCSDLFASVPESSPENYKDEIQFYSRSYKDYDTYTDWNKYKIVNYTELLRDIKLKEILNA